MRQFKLLIGDPRFGFLLRSNDFKALAQKDRSVAAALVGFCRSVLDKGGALDLDSPNNTMLDGDVVREGYSQGDEKAALIQGIIDEAKAAQPTLEPALEWLEKAFRADVIQETDAPTKALEDIASTLKTLVRTGGITITTGKVAGRTAKKNVRTKAKKAAKKAAKRPAATKRTKPAKRGTRKNATRPQPSPALPLIVT
jgi:hypothetical protein